MQLLGDIAELFQYIFVSGYLSYARSDLYYVQNMFAMPLHVAILEQFMRGEHTMRHNPYSLNGVWSDMLIESKYVRTQVRAIVLGQW